MATVPQVATALESVLTTTADHAASATGFIQRKRKLTGAAFVQGLVFGWLAHPAATYDQLVQAIAHAGVCITPQALERRFTPAAAQCLQDVLGAAVATAMHADRITSSLLQRFTGVWVLDTTIVALPATFATTWPGSGKSEEQGRTAAIKLHTCMNLTDGTLRGPLLGPARPHDKLSPLQTEHPPAGALRLTDLGFYSLTVLRDLTSAGVFWLCRAEVQTIVFTSDGQRWTLVELLAAQQGAVVDLSVTIGARQRLPARLVAFRLDGQAAARRRRKVRYIARRKSHPVSPDRLALCSWDVCITSIPGALAAASELRLLLRARWQIELLFKLWKSEGMLERSRSAQPWRILCEFYAKLVGLIIQHWCLVLGCWSSLERSLTKAGRVIRDHALILCCSLARPRRLHETLRALSTSLQTSCRVNTRRAHPNHCQLMRVSPHAA